MLVGKLADRWGGHKRRLKRHDLHIRLGGAFF